MGSSLIFTFTATSTLGGGDTTSSDEESDFIDYVIDDDDEDDDDDNNDKYFFGEIIDDVVDTFYGDEHMKLQHVHLHNLEQLEANQEQRRLDATLQTHRQQVVCQHQAQQQLEKYHVKMALYHVVKWAEDDAREEAKRQGLPRDTVQQPVWNSQFQLLHAFLNRQLELKDTLFPIVKVVEV